MFTIVHFSLSFLFSANSFLLTHDVDLHRLVALLESHRTSNVTTHDILLEPNRTSDVAT